MVCMAFMYQISPAGIRLVVISIKSLCTVKSPISLTVNISLFAVGDPFATFICSSFSFMVLGFISILPELFTLPKLLGITFGFTGVPLIDISRFSVFPII